MSSSYLYVLDNPDKVSNEKWFCGRDLANIPSPFRALFLSYPSGGKTCLIQNILLKAQPYYKKIYLCHPELSTSTDDTDSEDDGSFDGKVREYKHIDYTPLYDFPKPSFFKTDDDEKQILICDDVELRNLTKEQKKRLNKICSFASSHYNLSVIIASQDSFSQLNVALVRFMNIFCVWKYNDLNYMRMLLNRMGILKKEIDNILEHMKNYDQHDFLCIDRTPNTPFRFRKNMYMPVLTNMSNTY